MNCYTDGTLTNPKNVAYGLAGAAAWWPARRAATMPISKAEAELGDTEEKKDGVVIMTTVPGYGSSSTRSELAAGILAVAGDVAVHIGSDSQAFVNKAKRILKLTATGMQPEKPWSLQTNGDLWAIFARYVAVAFSRIGPL